MVTRPRSAMTRRGLVDIGALARAAPLKAIVKSVVTRFREIFKWPGGSFSPVKIFLGMSPGGMRRQVN
jgi:hypothetical protein